MLRGGRIIANLIWMLLGNANKNIDVPWVWNLRLWEEKVAKMMDLVTQTIFCLFETKVKKKVSQCSLHLHLLCLSETHSETP